MPIKLPRIRFQRLLSKKKRSNASARWLQRHINDPYCQAARRDHYRSRAAYKLIEIDEAENFLKPGLSVLDLGAAPGSWTQVILERIRPNGFVLALDKLDIQPLEGAHFLKSDFLSDENRLQTTLADLHPQLFDVILSDMAPESIGHKETDHLRIVNLSEEATSFALAYLKKGGTFLTKVWQGGMQANLLAQLKKSFVSVRHLKPKASRKESSELYLLARSKKYD